jgi:hypothetical protein
VWIIVAILLAVPENPCMWVAHDCKLGPRAALYACTARCAITTGYDEAVRACDALERKCESHHFFGCFLGPRPQAWLCEIIASDGTMDCDYHARAECETVDYDGDGDVDLRDWATWNESQIDWVRG